MTLVDTVLEDNINDNQYGGTSGTCTTDALVEMLHQWYEATDACNTYVRFIALDFLKAFDLINHEILLAKLEANGVPPHVLRWMASFLLDRTQRVKIGKHTSSIGKPNGGVPQGTVSGPRNFIMYINDLTTPAPMYKYVDDSTIFEICSGNAVSTIQQSIDDVVKWTDDNDMRLNCDKCKEMIVDFSRNQGQSSDAQDIFINEKTLDKVSHIKMLGVTVSNDLTWNIHVDNIVSKAGKRLYMLYKLKRGGISQRELVKIYIAIIRPVLEYACPVWNTCLPLYLSEAIEMIQKRALRSIYPGMHYNDILMLLKLPRLKERRDGVCKTYFDRLKSNINKLHHLLPERRDVSYPLRNQNAYPVPLTRTERFRKSLIPWCLHNWQ